MYNRLSSFIGNVNDAIELAQLGMVFIQKISVLLLLAYDDDALHMYRISYLG